MTIRAFAGVLTLAVAAAAAVATVRWPDTAFAQGPGGPPPARPQAGPPATQGRLAQVLAARLGLGEDLTEERAAGMLSAHGIVPETGWNLSGPATDVFLVQVQRSIHLLLTDVARQLNIPVPPTLNLMIFTPGQMGGQTFMVPSQDMLALMARGTASEADKLKAGETAKASIESPHPYPTGDAQLPAVWTYRLRHPGATFIKIHFARLELTAPDYLLVLDRYGERRWQHVGGSQQVTDIWAHAVDGDTAIIAIHAGDTKPGFGIQIDSYGYGVQPRQPK